jgi:hypothetical protein
MNILKPSYPTIEEWYTDLLTSEYRPKGWTGELTYGYWNCDSRGALSLFYNRMDNRKSRHKWNGSRPIKS